MLYRNYPREFRYQYNSARLPRGGTCFICHANRLTGLAGLPGGGHVVAAPFLAASRAERPEGALGTPLAADDPEGDAGLDVKWTPTPDLALDAALNPDFSQVETDAAQIAADERFALFFPEKRPFFLEGIDLFSTPLRAVHTRSITAPRWGARATGRWRGTAYTALVAQDRGGGSAILPGVQASSFARQDFASTVAITRLRHDLGRSFASFLATAREIDGGGSNRVFGPDFQWRPRASDTVTGQLLWSESRTPERPDLAPGEWTGQRLASHGADLSWFHSTSRVDWLVDYQDVGDEFRADAGFMPRVGYRFGLLEAGRTWRPTGLVRRLRPLLILQRLEERDGDVLVSQVSPGVELDGRWNSFTRVRYTFEDVASGAEVFEREQLLFTLLASPTRWLTRVSLQGFVGEEVDFDNSRLGDGGSVNAGVTVRPTDHLELRLAASRRWLDVRADGGRRGRLFTAEIERLRAAYTFTARAFLRVIGEWVETERDPTLYGFAVPARDGGFSGSALFGYKLNWQTVLFVGYGDERTLLEADRLEPAARELFLKVSYAVQR